MGKWRTPQQLMAEAEAKLAKASVRAAKQQRQDDLRRKILVGAFILSRVDGTAAEETLRAQLDGYLTRPDDRNLFGLPPLPIEEGNPEGRA
jgi:hypothetical protein